MADRKSILFQKWIPQSLPCILKTNKQPGFGLDINLVELTAGQFLPNPSTKNKRILVSKTNRVDAHFIPTVCNFKN